jgi:hypothetical protein
LPGFIEGPRVPDFGFLERKSMRAQWTYETNREEYFKVANQAGEGELA